MKKLLPIFSLAAFMMVFSFEAKADEPAPIDFDDISNQPTDAFVTDSFKAFLEAITSPSGFVSTASLKAAFGGGPFLSSFLPEDQDGDGFAEVANIFIRKSAGNGGDDLKQILMFLDNHPDFIVSLDLAESEGVFNEILIEVKNPDGTLPGVPLDGGLSFLALGGIAYGVKRFKKN